MLFVIFITILVFETINRITNVTATQEQPLSTHYQFTTLFGQGLGGFDA